MAGKYKDQGEIRRVERQKADPIGLGREGVERPVVREPSSRPQGAERSDRFHRFEGRISQFLGSVQKRLDSSWVYRSFKLPGTNYVVRDLRDTPEAPEGTVKKDQPFEVKDGKIITAKEKSYVNYLGERKLLNSEALKPLAQEILRLMSEFEKLLVERFEKGRKLEHLLENRKESHFLPKTREEWKSFFDRFLRRTVWRETNFKSLKEFVYRGLLGLSRGDGKYSMLIGDMATADGAVQKFARLQVLSDLAAVIQNMLPGRMIDPEILRRAVGAEEFRYLTLAHKHEERVVTASREVTKGMFGALKTEEQVADDLGLRRRSSKGYRGPIKWGKEGASEERHAFVPWGFWERMERKSWPKMATYLTWTIVSLLILVTVLIVIKQFV